MKPLTQKTLFFPFQGLLYQAQPKLLPGGNPLKSRNAQPEEPRLSCFLLSSSLHFFSISHFVPASVRPLLHFSSLTPSWLNTHTHTHSNMSDFMLLYFLWCKWRLSPGALENSTSRLSVIEEKIKEVEKEPSESGRDGAVVKFKHVREWWSWKRGENTGEKLDGMN